MKIKKKTSIMLLASTAAAVVGISAVSFAAWSGNKEAALSASASTGEAYLFGFESNTALTFGGTKLVPYNQKASTIVEGATVISDALPAYTVYNEDYTLTISLAEKTTSDDTTYYVLLTSGDTAPEAFDGTASAEVKEDAWLAVAADGVTINYTNTTGGEVAAKHLYVAMASENTGDMNQTFKFNVTLATKPAAQG